MEEDAKCGLTDCPPYWGKIKYGIIPVSTLQQSKKVHPTTFENGNDDQIKIILRALLFGYPVGYQIGVAVFTSFFLGLQRKTAGQLAI